VPDGTDMLLASDYESHRACCYNSFFEPAKRLEPLNS